MSDLKKIYHAVAYPEDGGEVEGFFDEAGELIATWSLNDANWRGEYMGCLLRHFGVEVCKGTEEHEAKLSRLWKDEGDVDDE